MRTLLLMALTSVASLAASAATVYKWVDENGVIHYSDQPHENAQKVELKGAQTYTPAKLAAPTPAGGQPPPSAVYQSCDIVAPQNDQMYMNTDTVTATVALQPSMRTGDQLVVTVDGHRVPDVPAAGGQFTISPIDRGTHSIQVTVQDPSGQSVCQSASVTFHVHQPSLLAPTQNAVRPRH